MKQHLAFEDLEKFSNREQIQIATLFGQYGNCCNTGGESINVGKLRGSITIGKLIECIRNHHQVGIYTVNENWCVQLYNLKDCANDEVSCIYENSSRELTDVLFECILWIKGGDFMKVKQIPAIAVEIKGRIGKPIVQGNAVELSFVNGEVMEGIFVSADKDIVTIEDSKTREWTDYKLDAVEHMKAMN